MWRIEIVIALLLTLAALALGITRAPADDGLRIEHAWMRPAADGATTAAYLTIVNAGSEDDTLIGARSGLARAIELHETRQEGDVVRMRRVAGGVPVPAGATLRLAPGGYHLMLIGLNRKLAAGDRAPLTLIFSRAGETEVDAVVTMSGPASAAGAAHHHR